MDPTRVVLDCDTANEVDDQFAIANALGAPEGTLDVRGVISVHNTTAHGPGSRDMYEEEAEWMVALCGSDVPCIPGAKHPMESVEEPVPSAGLDSLVDEARRSPLTIIATGPATDVASLLLAAPELRENLRVVWLGGFGDEASYRVWQNRIGELNGRAAESRPGAHCWKNPWISCTFPRGPRRRRYWSIRPHSQRSYARSDGPSHRTWPRFCSPLPPSMATGPKVEKNFGTWPA
jgi:inosine-uridine nucleoside N-ribohydrolase